MVRSRRVSGAFSRRRCTCFSRIPRNFKVKVSLRYARVYCAAQHLAGYRRHAALFWPVSNFIVYSRRVRDSRRLSRRREARKSRTVHVRLHAREGTPFDRDSDRPRCARWHCDSRISVKQSNVRQ